VSATITGRTGSAPARSRAPQSARPKLRVAPEVARRRFRARLVVWGTALVTVASLFTLVAFHVFEVQTAFRLEQLSKARNNELLRYERLREEVARNSSAETVIAEATRLGMVEDSSISYVYAPAAAGHDSPSGTPSSPLSTDAYQKTKAHLDPNVP
jgi:hypothetical protein